MVSSLELTYNYCTISDHGPPLLAIAGRPLPTIGVCLRVSSKISKVISNSRLKYYYFESVYMFRKVMILLFFTAPTMYVRMA